LNSNKIIKKRLPSKFYLIEGIDGSGKDTFVEIFAKELKKYFYFDPNYTLSIVGQPLSSCYKGNEALAFIENQEYTKSESEIVTILTKNRIDFNKKFSLYNGLFLCIRGLLTDIATLNITFNNQKKYILGQIEKIDKLIIVDIDPKIANKRIEKRGITRTWREYPQYLNFFRNFYLNFKDDCYHEKIIINNTTLNKLNHIAKKMAKELYIEDGVF